MSRILTRAGAALLAALSVSSPGPCSAQTRDAVTSALVTLTNALGGAFGDEGPQAVAALRDAENALSAWDAAIQRAEHGFATDRANVPPGEAAQMQAAIGSIYVQRGRFADGIRQLTAIGGLVPDAMTPALGQLLRAAQRAAAHEADANESLRSAWMHNPRDPALAVLAAEDVELSAPDLARVLDVLRDASLTDDAAPGRTMPFLSLALLGGVSAAPVFPPGRYARAYAFIEHGDLDAGLRALHQSIAADPLTAPADARPSTFVRGVAALRQGDIPAALAQLRAAVAEAPASSEAHRILGVALWADGSFDAAREELESALRRNPSDERAAVALADVLRDAEQEPLTRDILARAAEAVPESGQVHWELARLLEATQRDDEALAHYKQAAAAAPLAGEGRIFEAVGRIYHRRIDLDGALEAYAHRVRVEPNDPSAHRDLGGILQARDSHARAAIEFLAAGMLDPRDAEAFAQAGQSLLALGRLADAERACVRALAIDPAHGGARFTLATVLTRLGRADEGRQQLEAYRRQQQSALEAQRRTMALNGMKLQAQVQSQAGDYRGAASSWRQAIDLEGPRAETDVQLARVLAAAGDVDAAAAAYRDAVTRGGGAPAQRALVELLEMKGRAAEAAAARVTYEQMKRDRLRQLGAAR